MSGWGDPFFTVHISFPQAYRGIKQEKKKFFTSLIDVVNIRRSPFFYQIFLHGNGVFFRNWLCACILPVCFSLFLNATKSLTIYGL